eukprot:CAMPEP_0185789446 /NCGR_PEP_ID=MMETSP1174-20130828/151076_1 /TAXON_ID=35687 /ORGANISM="Dictyocha speculum, Strain CCMP1381" /LENGTH=58 /DNA_ID=CAMNT_0028483571 /DNA_START=35 /DNA_END=209 /DNA_ORIENTATION=+
MTSFLPLGDLGTVDLDPVEPEHSGSANAPVKPAWRNEVSSGKQQSEAGRVSWNSNVAE